MKQENSHGQLVTGMLFGALVGACATYLIIRNKESIQKGWENMSGKVKDGMDHFAHKAREKADEFTHRAKEKIHNAEEAADCLDEKMHGAASSKR